MAIENLPVPFPIRADWPSQASNWLTTQNALLNIRNINSGVVSALNYGAKGDGVTDDGPALQAWLTAASGKVALLPPGTYITNQALTIPQRNITIQGCGQEVSVIKYMGGDFVDVLTGDTLGEGYVRIYDIGIKGGSFQAGTARYGIVFGNFNNGSEINRINIRDIFGFIKITTGHLSAIDNLRCEASTPTRALGGATLAEWLEIYDDGHAPIHLKGMNACTLGKIDCYRIGSIVETGNTPNALILIENSVSCGLKTVQLEGCTTYTDGSTYDIRTQNLIRFKGSNASIDELYMEADYATSALVESDRTGSVDIREFTAFDMDCDSALFKNNATGDMLVRVGKMYKMRSPKLYKVTQTGYSLQGDVRFESVMTAAGNIYTSKTSDGAAGAPSDTVENVNDTYSTGSANLLGIADEDELNYSANRLVIPKKLTGLVVTIASDPQYTNSNGIGLFTATGHYVQITAGAFMREDGTIVQVKRPDGDATASTFAVFRLRSNNTSGATRYYRVFVGRAGNLYCVEYAAAQTDPTGNWLAEFTVSSTNTFSSLSQNARLGYTGIYIPNTTNVMVTGTAVPASGYWLAGDRVVNTTPSTSSPVQWVCTTAGLIGGAAVFTDQVVSTASGGGTAAGLLVNAATASVGLNQSGAASDEKLWDASAQGGQLVYRTRTDNNGSGTTWMTVDRTGTAVDAVSMGARLNTGKGADVAAANDLTLGILGNKFKITGNTQINGIAVANWQAGSEISLWFTGTPTVKHNTAASAGFASLLLNGSVDLVAANNTVLTLWYDGTNWQEQCRKVA